MKLQGAKSIVVLALLAFWKIAALDAAEWQWSVPVPPPPSGTFSVTMGAVSPFSTATLAPLKARKIAEHFARIKLLREAQDYDDALNLVDQVLLIDPNDDEALRLRDTLRDEARDRTVATEPRKGTP